MPTWWDSLGSVESFALWMRWIVVILYFLAGAATVLQIVAASRGSALRSQDDAKMKEQLRSAQSAADSTARELGESKRIQERLQTQVGQAERKAESAGKQAEETQSKIRPRRLSAAQFDELATILKNIPGQSVDFQFISGDAEAYRLLEQLINVFKASGWNVQNPREIFFGIHATGLFLIVRSVEDAPGYTKMLQDAFRDAGLDTPVFVDSNYEKVKQIRISVGHKPLPPE